MMDRDGKILVRDWLPRNGVPAEVRGVLDGCPVGGGADAATIDEAGASRASPRPRRSMAGTA
jgi:hypothetical protein